MTAINVEALVADGGIGISLTGMGIVFSGLIVMSVYVAVLPYVLRLLSGESVKRKTKKPAAEEVEKTKAIETAEAEAKKKAEEAEAEAAAAEAAAAEENDIASLIGLILHLEQERFLTTYNQLITIQRDSPALSLWSRAGRMRQMPQRRRNAKV